MRYALLGFPRSGTSWLAQCLNSLPGLAIAHEPFYQWTDPMLNRSWKATLDAYKEDRLNPDPDPDLLERISEMVADWFTRLAPEKVGFKEVYAGWKVCAFVEGIRRADPDARCVYLWRSFDGVLSSFERRDIFWWVDEVFVQLRDGVSGDCALLMEAIQPDSPIAGLFAAWLCQNYADIETVSAQAGTVVRYGHLAERDAAEWDRLKTSLGVDAEARISDQAFEMLNWHGTQRCYPDVMIDVAVTRKQHGSRAAELRDRALSVEDRVEHPGVLMTLLGVV